MRAAAVPPPAEDPSSPPTSQGREQTPVVLRALLAGLIDYAGLFPPASLDMLEVANRYGDYTSSDESWLLGRLVVPVARLAELGDVLRSHDHPPFLISALIGGDVDADARTIAGCNEQWAQCLKVDTCELRGTSPAQIAHAARALAGEYTVYVEVASSVDQAILLDVVAAEHVRAKIRTGGVTADAFPSPLEVARFLQRCAERTLAFKATAGLHHPIRGTYRLTYDSDAPRGVMFGFLNLFLAATLVRQRVEQDELVAILEETDPASFGIADHAISWRERALTETAIASARREFAVAFGSCSFREPVDDLFQLRLL